MFSARYKKLGAKIAYNRKLKDLTQAQLALAVGISTNYLSSVERGVSQGMPMSLLWRIADILDVKIEELLKE